MRDRYITDSEGRTQAVSAMSYQELLQAIRVLRRGGIDLCGLSADDLLDRLQIELTIRDMGLTG